jgi:hypothetical protein
MIQNDIKNTENNQLICEHISVSRKQTWEECQVKYKYKYHLKIIPDAPTAPHFTYGSLVHKIAEVYVKEKGLRPIEDITSDCLNGLIEVEKGNPPPDLSSEYKKKLPKHIKHIKALTDRIGYDGFIEWPFYFDLNPPEKYHIKGFIDRLIVRGEKYFILDYKTTKKGKYRKNKSNAHQDLQLRCYARVVQRELGAKPENIWAAFYYVDGTSPELISTKFTEQSLIDVEKEMYETYKNIVTTNPNDVFGRVGWQCKNCDYKNICNWYSLT